VKTTPSHNDDILSAGSEDDSDAVSRIGFDTNEASESIDEDHSGGDDSVSCSDSDSSIDESSEPEDETPRFDDREAEIRKKHTAHATERDCEEAQEDPRTTCPSYEPSCYCCDHERKV